MTKRPISLLVLGWIFIAVGSIALVYHGSELASRRQFDPELLWVCLVRLAAIVAGVFLLRGCNWARWLLVAWMVFHLALSALHSPVELFMHAVLFGVIGFLLFRPNASAYLRSGAVEIAEPKKPEVPQ